MSFSAAATTTTLSSNLYLGGMQQQQDSEGKYARSTASSRSRTTKEDAGMTQSGIYEAFAEADSRFPIKPPVKKYPLDTRRKSTVDVTKKATVPLNGSSPRLKSTKVNLDRRQTLSGSVMSTKEKKDTGLIKLADTLRDTLVVERRLAKQEMGLLDKKTLLNNEQQDVISNAKQRQSVTKEKLRSTLEPTAPNNVRRRTLSSGSSLLQKEQQQLKEASYMKATLAEQRRHSVNNMLANRRNSSASPNTATLKTEDEKMTLKRRSILAAATAKARQQQQQQVDSSCSSGDEQKQQAPTSVRSRKKSFADLENRRMSRTENLKEGLPTHQQQSPTLTATKMARRKSVVNPSNLSPSPKKQPEPVVTAPKPKIRKRGTTLPGSLAKPPTIVQSSQLPPMKLEPIKLYIPPTTTTKKPKSPLKSTASTKVLAKKRMSLSTAVTPVSSSSTSSTEASNVIITPPKKSMSTRKAKGLSHLGIQSRRTSLRAPSTTTQIITPPLKTPVLTASPRVGPRSTRRTSLGTTLDNKSSPALVPSTAEDVIGSRKMSNGSTYSSSSRKNSIIDESNTASTTGRHQNLSLKDKLEAMVAQHPFRDDRTPRKPQQPPQLDVDFLLTAEERAKPQRIRDTLMMWDKEMVEAFSPGIPKSPSIAIKFYGHHLSPFEQTEIQSYPEVYFVGHHAKKHQAMPDNSHLNYGYDDERGDYKSVLNDHLGYRYEILEELGRGSFGQVVKCYDHKTASTVAVKLIRNKKRFYAQAKTEVKILSDLVKWDPEDRHHNVKMTDHFYFRSHLCIACECLSMNLYEFIKINNFQGFHITLIKRFTIQLLRSLSLLSRHGVVHCDLKPENILLKHPTKSTIKVIDFGSSCLQNQRVYTYIQSRFYRSPEIILGLDYTMAIDMWSLGCIIAELYTGVPIFPGENEQEQLACIMEVLGVPDPQLIQSSERRNLFFDRRGEPRVVCNSRGKKRRAGTKNLSQALRCHDPLFLDFIRQCLDWDPAKRLNPEKAFQHEWITQSTTPKPIEPSAIVKTDTTTTITAATYA